MLFPPPLACQTWRWKEHSPSALQLARQAVIELQDDRALRQALMARPRVP